MNLLISWMVGWDPSGSGLHTVMSKRPDTVLSSFWVVTTIRYGSCTAVDFGLVQWTDPRIVCIDSSDQLSWMHATVSRDDCSYINFYSWCLIGKPWMMFACRQTLFLSGARFSNNDVSSWFMSLMMELSVYSDVPMHGFTDDIVNSVPYILGIHPHELHFTNFRTTSSMNETWVLISNGRK